MLNKRKFKGKLISGFLAVGLVFFVVELLGYNEMLVAPDEKELNGYRKAHEGLVADFDTYDDAILNSAQTAEGIIAEVSGPGLNEFVLSMDKTNNKEFQVHAAQLKGMQKKFAEIKKKKGALETAADEIGEKMFGRGVLSRRLKAPTKAAEPLTKIPLRRLFLTALFMTAANEVFPPGGYSSDGHTRRALSESPANRYLPSRTPGMVQTVRGPGNRRSHRGSANSLMPEKHTKRRPILSRNTEEKR